MRKQERKVNTPCCNKRLRHEWERGKLQINWTCPFCGANYELNFNEGYNGRTGRLKSKRLLPRYQK